MKSVSESAEETAPPVGQAPVLATKAPVSQTKRRNAPADLPSPENEPSAERPPALTEIVTPEKGEAPCLEMSSGLVALIGEFDGHAQLPPGAALSGAQSRPERLAPAAHPPVRSAETLPEPAKAANLEQELALPTGPIVKGIALTRPPAFQTATPVEPAPPAAPESPLPKSLSRLLNHLKVQEVSKPISQPEVAPRPLLVELLQRLQSATPVQAALEVSEKQTVEESQPTDKSAPVTEGSPTLSLLSELKPAFASKTMEPAAAPVPLPDQVEHTRQLARQQGKALIEKPRDLEVLLHSDRLGEVAARVHVEAGGQWTAHVQLRDAEVEKSVRQELSQMKDTRGLEGFTTSLSQDGRSGFSFEQQQQRSPAVFFQKRSATPSTSEDPLPIAKVSSLRTSGLNIRA